MTLWPSGLRRWLKAPFRKGVGSNPTGVNLLHPDSSSLLVGWVCMARLIHPHASSLLVSWTSQQVIPSQYMSVQVKMHHDVSREVRTMQDNKATSQDKSRQQGTLAHKLYTSHSSGARSYQPRIALGIEPMTSRPTGPRLLQQAPWSVCAPCSPLT